MGGRPVGCPIVALNVWEEDGGFEGGRGLSLAQREGVTPPPPRHPPQVSEQELGGGMIYI